MSISDRFRRRSWALSRSPQQHHCVDGAPIGRGERKPASTLYKQLVLEQMKMPEWAVSIRRQSRAQTCAYAITGSVSYSRKGVLEDRFGRRVGAEADPDRLLQSPRCRRMRSITSCSSIKAAMIAASGMAGQTLAIRINMSRCYRRIFVGIQNACILGFKSI